MNTDFKRGFATALFYGILDNPTILAPVVQKVIGMGNLTLATAKALEVLSADDNTIEKVCSAFVDAATSKSLLDHLVERYGHILKGGTDEDIN